MPEFCKSDRDGPILTVTIPITAYLRTGSQ